MPPVVFTDGRAAAPAPALAPAPPLGVARAADRCTAGRADCWLLAPPACCFANCASCSLVMLYQSAGAASTRVAPMSWAEEPAGIVSGDVARELAAEFAADAGCELARDTAGDGAGAGGTAAADERVATVAGGPAEARELPPCSAAARLSAWASSAELRPPREASWWLELARLTTGVDMGVRGTTWLRPLDLCSSAPAEGSSTNHLAPSEPSSTRRLQDTQRHRSVAGSCINGCMHSGLTHVSFSIRQR